ncbi:MAG: DUF4190 domain-containing protein [Planctomycetota bacterium]|nr:DUF4190 domain-containing protein [Planctomycetota bacterium]
MAIEVSCPDCFRLLRVDELHVGKQARCPACETVFTVTQQNAGEGIASETDTPSSNPFAPSSAPVPWDKSAASGADYQNVAPHRGTLILVMGLLSWFCCCGFGIVAWVLGSQDIKLMEAGQMDPSGLGITKAGYWIGIISLLLNLLVMAGYAVVIVFAILSEM